jgi:acyl-CoA synthetase (AMP-forming)/AMP-acid ligase II
MIKTSGYRVSPQEVEEVLFQLFNINEVIVIGIPHKDLGQVLLVIIVTKQPLDEKTVIKHCKVDLPNYMLLKKIIFTESIPRNSNGKFDCRFWQNKYQNLFVQSN